MVMRLNLSTLRDPATAHQQALAEHHETEERTDVQPQSLCNQCRYAFIFSQSKARWDEEPRMETHCTGPWLEHAMETYGVSACNAFTQGKFDPTEFHEEDESIYRGEMGGAPGESAAGSEGEPGEEGDDDDTDEDDDADEEGDVEKANHADFDAQLSALEKEPASK